MVLGLESNLQRQNLEDFVNMPGVEEVMDDSGGRNRNHKYYSLASETQGMR